MVNKGFGNKGNSDQALVSYTNISYAKAEMTGQHFSHAGYINFLTPDKIMYIKYTKSLVF